MSSSMSPPPQRPNQSFSPPFQGNAASPTSAAPFGQPPAKRQRLSPDPRSPQGAQPVSHPTQAQPNNGAAVTSAYGNPYATQQSSTVQSPQSYAASPQNAFNTPQPYPFQQMPWQSQSSTQSAAQSPVVRQGSPPQTLSREMMPPPPRPNREEREERVGVDEIGDSLYGSGINLKDEENYMHNVYINRHETLNGRQNPSFANLTASPSTSFNNLSQDTIGSQERNGAFAGTMGQPRSQEAMELEDRRKREAAATARAERMQHHLNNQFLQCNNVRKRIDKVARNHGVMLNLNGVMVRQAETKTSMNGAGTTGIAAADQRITGVKNEDRTESSVNQGAPFEHLLALLSLAAGERIRGLLDESHALARARRYGDHGKVVPPEFADIASGEGKVSDEQVVPENISGSQWDKTPNDPAAGADGQKERSATAETQSTISFQGTLTSSLRDLADRDRQAEKDRIKKREARKRAAEASTTIGDTAGATADAAGASPASGPAETAAPVKVSKKEQAKQQKEKSNAEAQSHNSVNQTAMMALGGKRQKYSWMRNGATNVPTNRYAKPANSAGSGAATPAEAGAKGDARSPAGAGPGAVAGAANGAVIAAEPSWGDFLESGPGGKGVQLRDLVFVLERDGRERLALEKAMSKMS